MDGRGKDRSKGPREWAPAARQVREGGSLTVLVAKEMAGEVALIKTW